MKSVFSKSLISVVLFALAALTSLAKAQGIFDRPFTIQSRESYEAAIRNDSTSPSYVLISIVRAYTGQAKSVCTTANFLLGAIHREFGLEYGPADVSKATKIALASHDHTFLFRQPVALANIPISYSGEDLAAARKFLAPIPTDELRIKFSSLFDKSRLPTDGYNRDAIACALIERGLSPRLSDRSNQVYVTREQMKLTE
jgi:hypothetical protein